MEVPRTPPTAGPGARPARQLSAGTAVGIALLAFGTLSVGVGCLTILWLETSPSGEGLDFSMAVFAVLTAASAVPVGLIAMLAGLLTVQFTAKGGTALRQWLWALWLGGAVIAGAGVVVALHHRDWVNGATVLRLASVL